jgi:hypothetical protein
LHTSFSEEGLQQLKDLLHRSPRDFGLERSTWTLELAAQISFFLGIVSERGASYPSGRTILAKG